MADGLDINMLILVVCVFVVAPLIKLTDKVLSKRWKQDLMDFQIAKDVVKIYREYNQEKKEKVSWMHQQFENFKKRIRTYFEKKKHAKKDRIEYGI